MAARKQLDLVLINPGSRTQVYQALGTKLAAVENPVWAGLMATRTAYLRQLPGRISGQTTDHDGRRGFVLMGAGLEVGLSRRETCLHRTCVGVVAALVLMGCTTSRTSTPGSRSTSASGRLFFF